MAPLPRALVRALFLGFLGWFVPFAISFALFPVRKSNLPLFTALMYLVLLVTAGALFWLYFLRRPVRIWEAAFVGMLWVAISLLLDYPLFAFGPMKMTALAYYSEIGIVYLTFPVFGILAAPLARRTGVHRASVPRVE